MAFHLKGVFKCGKDCLSLFACPFLFCVLAQPRFVRPSVSMFCICLYKPVCIRSSSRSFLRMNPFKVTETSIYKRDVEQIQEIFANKKLGSASNFPYWLTWLLPCLTSWNESTWEKFGWKQKVTSTRSANRFCSCVTL